MAAATDSLQQRTDSNVRSELLFRIANTVITAFLFSHP